MNTPSTGPSGRIGRLSSVLMVVLTPMVLLRAPGSMPAKQAENRVVVQLVPSVVVLEFDQALLPLGEGLLTLRRLSLRLDPCGLSLHHPLDLLDDSRPFIVPAAVTAFSHCCSRLER